MAGKRVLDVVLSSAMLLAALPLILVFALGLAVSMRCWPFFRQQRVGHNGELFNFWKLRTLPPSAPKYADKYAIKEVKLGRLARLLRAKHLDELPQLLLVVLGKMSLVGPRPEMACLHDAADPVFARARTSVRPGCTGLWQASVDQDRLIWETPHYDSFYLAHAGARLDLWILWRTALMMLHLRNPVEMADVPRWVGRRPILVPALWTPSELQRWDQAALPLRPSELAS